jgi:hypothetical protein
VDLHFQLKLRYTIKESDFKSFNFFDDWEKFSKGEGLYNIGKRDAGSFAKFNMKEKIAKFFRRSEDAVFSDIVGHTFLIGAGAAVVSGLGAIVAGLFVGGMAHNYQIHKLNGKLRKRLERAREDPRYLAKLDEFFDGYREGVLKTNYTQYLYRRLRGRVIGQEDVFGGESRYSTI